MSVNELHYFLPTLWHRHIEIALCSHEHRDLDTANQCLQTKKQTFDKLLQDPNLPKQLRKHYQNAMFLVRELVLKQCWVTHEQHDHLLDGSTKGHWTNKFVDLMHLPLVGIAPDDLPVDKMITKIDNYRHQPKRRSKNRPKVEQVASLNDFLSVKIPDYLRELTSSIERR